MNKIKDMMKEISELNKTHGIAQRGGKKYTQVKDRVDGFRKHCEFNYGIETFKEVDDGKRIVFKAMIKDLEGTVIGCGYAEEIRGQGYVNKTSAVENCETSSIGRALSSCGLSGGEYASSMEMDIAKNKKKGTDRAVSTQNRGKSTRTNQDLKDAIHEAENTKYSLSFPGNKSGKYPDAETAISAVNEWLWTVETYDEKPKDQRLMAIGAFFEQNKNIISFLRKENPNGVSEIDARIKRFEDA